MALRGKKPEAMTKRLKLFIYSSFGVGKTTAAISFPRTYVIDGERGTDHYVKGLTASGSVVYQTTDVDDAIKEVRELKSSKHDFLTAAVDPVTTLEADLMEKCAEAFPGENDMRKWGMRDKTMRRLMNLLLGLDMNVIVTAHGKVEYGEKMVKLGTTFDAWRRWPYAFDLALELERRGTKRIAIVRKTRISDAFPDGDTFEFSYAEVARRYGAETLERAAEPVAIASADQVATLRALIDTVKLEEGAVDGWLRKAGVDALEDLPAVLADKAITFVRNKIAKTGGAT